MSAFTSDYAHRFPCHSRYAALIEEATVGFRDDSLLIGMARAFHTAAMENGEVARLHIRSALTSGDFERFLDGKQIPGFMVGPLANADWVEAEYEAIVQTLGWTCLDDLMTRYRGA